MNPNIKQKSAKSKKGVNKDTDIKDVVHNADIAEEKQRAQKTLKGITGRIIFLLVISIIIGIISLFKNCYVCAIRDGNEYIDGFFDGQTFRQELILEHTPHITVALGVNYSAEPTGVGFKYTLTMGDKTEEGFLPITDFVNNEWANARIYTHNFWYVGEAELVLESVGVDAENFAQALITTNTLQKNPECQLFKDGALIENGRFPLTYETYDLTSAALAALIAFVVLFVLFVLAPVQSLVKRYPAAFLTMLLFAVGVIQYWPFAGYADNLHIVGQYEFTWQNLGFVRRSFAGTIMELLRFHLTPQNWPLFCLACIVVMLALELVILYDKRNLGRRAEMEKCWPLYLCMPFGVMYLFTANAFGRLDQFLLIAFLLICITLIKEKGTFLIPVLSLMAILTHEMYLTLLIPFVFCLLLYKWYVTKNKKYLVNLIITSISSVAVAVYVGFIAKPAVPYDEAWAYIQEHNDPAVIFDWLLSVNHYTSSSGQVGNAHSEILFANGIPMLGMMILFFLPLILLTSAWILTMCKKSHDKLGRYIPLLLFCTVAGLFASCYTGSDYNRFCAVYATGFFFTFITLWSIDPERAGGAAREVWNRATDKWGRLLYPAMLLFYMIMAMFGPGGSG